MNTPARDPGTAAPSAPRPLPPALLLLGGGILIFFTFMRFSLPDLGWVAFAPFLVFLHERSTVKRHLVLLAVLAVATVASVSKLVTSEISWAPVPMFALPLALSYFLALTLAGAAHRHLGARYGAYTFAAMAVVMGWIQYSFTEGSSWGALAHTQLENLPLVELVSLTGIGGLTFLVALGSGLLAAAWSSGVPAVRTDLIVFGVLLGAALLYGELRLASPAPGPSVRIGAVVSPITHKDFAPAFTDVDTLRQFDDGLFARSARAADYGARVVVWNEVATLTSVTGEGALAARGQAFAKARNVMLLMAYGVVDSVRPFHFHDKYRIYLPDGRLADEYVKRHPVPGDPNDKGTLHARVVSFAGVRFTGAICYDYGFPGIAWDNANDGGDVALLPSSDWRGIDPEHGRMALMNAVAVGLPMVRPVRAATTIVSDQYGRLIGSMRADGSGGGVLVADVPGQRVPTLYVKTGEIVPLGALAFCLFVLAAVILRKRGGPQHV